MIVSFRHKGLKRLYENDEGDIIDGVRAAVVHDEITAQLARSHNDANVLCLSADLLGQRLIEKIVDAAIATPFAGGRHARRLRKIEAIEQGRDPSGVQDE